MISQTRAMEIVVTNSEAEALLLEAQLIKRYRPPFNVLLTQPGRLYAPGASLHLALFQTSGLLTWAFPALLALAAAAVPVAASAQVPSAPTREDIN